MKTKFLNKHNCGLGFAFLLSTLVSFNTNAALPAGYTITDLGANIFPNAINDAGQVAGENRQNSSNIAFLYSDGVMNHFLGNAFSGAYGLNNLGHVVGYIDTGTSEGFPAAYVYDGVTVTNLAPGILHQAGTRGGINNSGQIVGQIDFDFAVGFSPFVYDPNGNIMNTITSGFASGDTGAFAINDSGQFIVQYDSLGTSSQFLSRLYNNMTTFTEIPNFPGAPSDAWIQARAINNQGHVTGISPITTDGGGLVFSHAFLFDGTNTIDLGVGEAQGINDLDQVVGGSQLFDGATVTDLNTLLALGSGWTIESTLDINNLGQIVGTGLLNGEQHGFLLTPTAVPIPSAIWLFGSALATFVGVGKRKQRV